MQNILFQWFYWHYLEMPKELLRAWKNFLKFNFEYFSIRLLIKTLFFPWRRYQMSYGRGFDIGRFFESFFSNLIFRTLGAIVRSVLIFIGLLAQFFIIFIGVIIIALWLFLPLFLILGLYYGFKILL